MEFLAPKDQAAAKKVRAAIRRAVKTLEVFPFSCRGIANAKNVCWRELIVSFGREGCVLLFEIENATTVTIAAVRHQREDDFLL